MLPSQERFLMLLRIPEKILPNHSLADLVPLQIMTLVILVNLYQEMM